MTQAREEAADVTAPLLVSMALLTALDPAGPVQSPPSRSVRRLPARPGQGQGQGQAEPAPSRAPAREPAAGTAATLQARIDECGPGEAVEIRGTVKLDRPLILSRDGVSILGAPKGILKPAGAFPAIIAGPPLRRYPRFASKHRVRIDRSTDGTLTHGLDLGGPEAPEAAVLRLRASAFELGPAGGWGKNGQITIAALLIRKGDSWGNNDTAPVLSTDSDRATPDPIRLLVRPTRVSLEFRTDDGVHRRLAWRRPADLPVARLEILLDFDRGQFGAYVDGALAEVDASALGRDWKPGLRLAAPEFSDLTVGADAHTGRGNYVLGGLKVASGLAAPLESGPGARRVGKDGKPATDAALFGKSPSGRSVSLDLDVPPTSADDPLVWYRFGAGPRHGCGLLVPFSWGPYDTVGELEVRDLTIQGGDQEYGSCLEVGVVRNLRLRDLIVSGAARGIDCNQKVVSYPLWISDVRFTNQREVALVLGRGIVYADGLDFSPGPARAQMKIHSAGGVIERFFMAEQPCPAPIVIKNFGGQLTLRDGIINYEGAGPEAYIRVARDQTGVGIKAQLVIDHVEVGNASPKVAIVDLQDPYWKGRTDTVGSGLLTIRDSFTIVRPSTIARPSSDAWTVEVSGPTAPGTTATPGLAPTPAPAPSPPEAEPRRPATRREEAPPR